MDEAKNCGECETVLTNPCENIAVKGESSEPDSTSNLTSAVEESESRHCTVPHVLSTTLSSAIQIYQPSLGNGFTSFGLLPRAIPQLSSNSALFSCDRTSFVPQIPHIVPNQALLSCDGSSLTANGFSADNILASTSNTVFFATISTSRPTKKEKPQTVTRTHDVQTVERRKHHYGDVMNKEKLNAIASSSSIVRNSGKKLSSAEISALTNACNLYYRKNKRPRPLSLCRNTITKRNRKSTNERRADNATS
ncbi:hypothetical protein DICVIV_04473 [Dictyocaulus viviparus]|uniref:GATA-type domain-containing protein n=1 Tax=Dictyocaulus viviparus TaxID=29172 RepID=A0A0D8XY20_DICVI|nr:hypothetical protein DICVIV_04473 [Dictyocaulus viviparus]